MISKGESMTPKTAASCLMAALILVGATSPLPTSAAQGRNDSLGQGRIFDGAAGAAWTGLEEFGQSVAAAIRPSVSLGAAARPVQRSDADLYYFSPAEAEQAAKALGMADDSGGTLGYKFDADVPLDIQNQMRGDLAFMGSIQGAAASKLHQSIFGEVAGAAYTQFFESRVKAIGMDDCGSGNAVACVIPFRGSSKMWLTQNFIRFSHPQVSRMMVVFHESRHTEVRNGNWSHAYCPDPFKDANGKDMKSIWTGAKLAGEPACDKTPFGSYGSSMIMLKNIQKFCSNCTDKVRMDAGIYADDQFNRVTNPEARKQIQADLYQ
jgi:hypothetical protein